MSNQSNFIETKENKDKFSLSSDLMCNEKIHNIYLELEKREKLTNIMESELDRMKKWFNALPMDIFTTARIDLKNIGDNNDLKIIDVSDNNIRIKRPSWLSDDTGQGIMLLSSKKFLKLKIKCINDGKLKLLFKGPFVTDKNNQRIPVFIEYSKIEINNHNILKESITGSYNNPFIKIIPVNNNQEIDLYIEWGKMKKQFDSKEGNVLKDISSTERINQESYVLDEENIIFNELNESKEQINNLKFELEKKESLTTILELELEKFKKWLIYLPQPQSSSLGMSTKDGKIIYRNWWRVKVNELDSCCDNFWFSQFIKDKFPDVEYKLNFFSVFNKHQNLAEEMDGKKIFFSGENLNKIWVNFNKEYGTYALDYTDLSMGYDLIEQSKYLRFPLWLLYHFSPTSTEEEIEQKIYTWNNQSFEKTKNVVAIANHDKYNVRTIISKDVEKSTKIYYAGKWNNNTDELWQDYNDNKLDYIKHFKFNLCAENVIDTGYVTEKIFDAIVTDCIPLYAGGGDYLEPKIINHKGIIRWNENEDNSDAIELFNNLLLDEKTYNNFKNQFPVLESSYKFIIKKFKMLEKHFERLIYD